VSPSRDQRLPLKKQQGLASEDPAETNCANINVGNALLFVQASNISLSTWGLHLGTLRRPLTTQQGLAIEDPAEANCANMNVGNALLFVQASNISWHIHSIVSAYYTHLTARMFLL
jgi:hypothetical protein